jgi:hypothetical protein
MLGRSGADWHVDEIYLKGAEEMGQFVLGGICLRSGKEARREAVTPHGSSAVARTGRRENIVNALHNDWLP